MQSEAISGAEMTATCHDRCVSETLVSPASQGRPSGALARRPLKHSLGSVTSVRGQSIIASLFSHTSPAQESSST